MSHARWPWAAITLACLLQIAGIARTQLPGHDGLKILRTAAQFQTQPWLTVIRGSDRHPLYPMLVALAEPVVAAVRGAGPDTWRITAQLVSAVANIALMLPLFSIAATLFDRRVAHWTCMLWAVLPIPGEVGHETLADPVALLCFTTALCGLVRAAQGDGLGWALLTGLATGVGYWARPEIALVALVGAGVLLILGSEHAIKTPTRFWPRRMWPAAFVITPTLLCCGAYGGVKGEISEKLALRRSLGLPPSAAPKVDQATVGGDAVSRFTPKADDDAREVEPGLTAAAAAVMLGWARALGVLLAPLALAGFSRADRSIGQQILRAYAICACAVVIRHVSISGYFSSRHVLTLVIASLPWAAWRLTVLGNRLAGLLRWNSAFRVRAAPICAIAIALLGVAAQHKPSHPTRAGHLRAGRWLAAADLPSASVFDTNGWAAFVSGRRWHDPWHLRDALADKSLGYIVLERSELDADTERGDALRAVVSARGHLVAQFDAGRETNERVLIYAAGQPARELAVRP